MDNPLQHFVNGRPLTDPYPKNLQQIGFAIGCFWGAERLFWSLSGVYLTSVGYQGGHVENPHYGLVCQKQTGHAEAVQVVFDPKQISVEKLLAVFWENHDPTQGARQGNDIGPQYRSAVFVTSEQQQQQVQRSVEATQQLLDAKGFGTITTEIILHAKYWLAEQDHQQYLAKNPGGYCGLQGTGISCGTAETKA